MTRKMGMVILAGVLAGQWSWAEETTRLRDFDGDGVSETAVYYKNGHPIRAVADRDGDGYAEAVYFYQNDRRDRADIDLGRDGKPDQWITYDPKTGIPWKAAYDFDGNGRPDYWVFYANGAIYKWEQDRNGDGRADVRTTYEPALFENSYRFRQIYDDDFDGNFESSSRMAPIRPDARIPHSMAEALLH